MQPEQPVHPDEPTIPVQPVSRPQAGLQRAQAVLRAWRAAMFPPRGVQTTVAQQNRSMVVFLGSVFGSLLVLCCVASLCVSALGGGGSGTSTANGGNSGNNVGAVAAHSTATSNQTETGTGKATTTTVGQPTATATSQPSPTVTATPKPKPTATPRPRPTATPKPSCPYPAVNGNPWCYNWTGSKLIYSPASAFCSYFACITTFWNGKGYVIQCVDGTFSKSGGIQGQCSQHGGYKRTLYKP